MTRRLIFGCGYIPPYPRRHIEAALDLGIRHFDVAPYYGRGYAEQELGKALKSFNGEVGVTTKYGLLDSRDSAIRFVWRTTLSLRSKRTKDGAKEGGSAKKFERAPKREFSPQGLRRSVESSLRHLRRGRIDILLLHEPNLEDCTANILAELLDLTANGKIGTFGIGGTAKRASLALTTAPDFCRVLQTSWPPLSAKHSHCRQPDILFGVLRVGKYLHSELNRFESDLRTWSIEVDSDLSNEEKFVRLFLRGVLERTTSNVIFSGSSEAHIQSCVTAAEDHALAIPAVILYDRICDAVRAGLFRL